MQSLRVLTDGDQELTSFLQEIRATLVAPPTGAVATALPARLAAEARAAAPGASGRNAVRRPRRALARPLLRIGFAVAAIPLLFTGLAFAGVNLPSPANSAFESIGIDLPNQAEDDVRGAPDDDDTEGTAHDGDSAGSATGQSNSSGKLGHGKTKPNPARADDKPAEGRAVGRDGTTPGSAEDPGDEGKAVGKPDSPPSGPPESQGPPQSPGSQGKPPRGVQEQGSSGQGGAVDPNSAGSKGK